MTQQIQGTFLSLSENVNEVKGQKAYDFFKVNYTNQNGERKVYSGFQNSLKYNRQLANDLRKLQQGDNIILVIGKNKANYDELQAVSVTNGRAGEARLPTASGNSGTSTGSGQSRSYSGETPEERARRQVLIVKQSSLSSAVETVKVEGGVPTTEEVLAVAQEYFDWVMSTGSAAKELPKKEDKASGPTIDLDDDIPY